MRLITRDLPLVPLLLPVVAIGLFPLVMLPLLGFLGFVVLGILIGFAAVMAELEEPQAHTQYVISHGPMSRAEQAGFANWRGQRIWFHIPCAWTRRSASYT